MEVIFVMKCKFCGAELSDDAVICTECGKEVINTAEPVAVKSDVNPGKGLGIVAMILGIAAFALPLISSPCLCIPYLGWLVMGIIDFIAFLCPIAGLLLAIVASKKSKAAGHNNVMAKIGMILSIVYIGIWVVSFLIGLVFGVLAFLLGFGTIFLETLMYY